MTATSVPQHRSPARHAAATHVFAIGQTVRMRGNFGTFPKTAEAYRITATLPPRGGSFQYRIRNDDERYERMATEDSLEAMLVPPADEGPALIERTFGQG